MFKIFTFLISILLFISCSKENIKKSSINEKSLDLQVAEAYEEGMKSLKEGDVLFAAKKFNEAEILYPQSMGAKSSINGCLLILLTRLLFRWDTRVKKIC